MAFNLSSLQNRVRKVLKSNHGQLRIRDPEELKELAEEVEQSGLSDRELSPKLGISAFQVSYIRERAKRGQPARRPKFLPVRIRSSRLEKVNSKAYVFKTPSGLIIESVDREAAAELLKLVGGLELK